MTASAVEPIAVDAVVAQGLEKRPTHPLNSVVWVRRSDDGVIEKNEVVGIVMLMTHVAQFHVHYFLMSLIPGRPVFNRVVAWHHVHGTYDEAVSAPEKPPFIDPMAADTTAAFDYVRQVRRAGNPRT